MSNLHLMQARNFLTAVLGPDGFEALNKAAQRLPELQSVFVPRTVIAWLDIAQRLGYEGEIPGTQATLTKGELVVDGQSYERSDASRAGAALMINLMEDVSIPEDLDPKLVARLAKSVETLTKRRFLDMIKALEEAAEISPGEATGSSETTQSVTDVEDLDKGIDEPGAAAKPRAPLAPDAPDAALKAPGVGMGQAKPTPAVSRARGFFKSELVRACPRCHQTQMRGRQVVGCLCITDVVMSAELTQKSEGDRVVLSGPDAVIVAIEERLGLAPST